ncbi:MAG: hypothetical protein JWM11_3489 [Planctomycetaceae bacterium]|nr:hypothetical protein [Planctomycetaceae bacterium]
MVLQTLAVQSPWNGSAMNVAAGSAIDSIDADRISDVPLCWSGRSWARDFQADTPLKRDYN